MLDSIVEMDDMAAKRKRIGGWQASLPFAPRGGVRRGAGRKKSKDSGVSHLERAKLGSSYPVHVTVRLLAGFRSLRQVEEYRVLRGCFEAGREGCVGQEGGFRLVHYSVQGNHLHLLVEAVDRVALSRGMQGLLVRIARGLNRLWKRKGRVFADRYHDHVLKTSREVRNALAYVLNNARHHGLRLRQLMDIFTSAGRFDGWKEKVRIIGKDNIPVTAPRTWLLSKGWRQHRLISVHEIPGGAP